MVERHWICDEFPRSRPYSSLHQCIEPNESVIVKVCASPGSHTKNSVTHQSVNGESVYSDGNCSPLMESVCGESPYTSLSMLGECVSVCKSESGLAGEGESVHSLSGQNESVHSVSGHDESVHSVSSVYESVRHMYAPGESVYSVPEGVQRMCAPGESVTSERVEDECGRDESVHGECEGRECVHDSVCDRRESVKGQKAPLYADHINYEELGDIEFRVFLDELNSRHISHLPRYVQHVQSLHIRSFLYAIPISITITITIYFEIDFPVSESTISPSPSPFPFPSPLRLS